MTSPPAPPRRPRVVDSFGETYHERRDVPAEVVTLLASVSSHGCSDMWDRERVLALAAAGANSEPARWLARNRHLYFVALRELQR